MTYELGAYDSIEFVPSQVTRVGDTFRVYDDVTYYFTKDKDFAKTAKNMMLLKRKVSIGFEVTLPGFRIQTLVDAKAPV